MADIIPFGKKPDIVVATHVERQNPNHQGEKTDIREALGKILAHEGIKGTLIGPILSIRGFLDDLHGHVSHATIASNREGLGRIVKGKPGPSDEDLREIAKEANKLKVTKNPAYYRALLDEIESRQII